MTDHDLDDLKDRLHRCFGVQVHRDLQVRAEIIIQPEAGRWLFTPAELGDAGWPFRLTRTQYIGLFTPIYHGV